MRFIFEARMQAIPSRSFVDVDDRAFGNARLDPVKRSAFRAEHCRQRIAVAPADDDDSLAPAVLVFPKATVEAIFLAVRRLHIAAEVPAVDLGHLAFTADGAALHFLCHGFTHLVAENESGLVGQPQVAGHGEHALALDLIAEDRDGRQIAAQGQLVRREQRAGRDAEILLAGAAPEAAGTIRRAAIIGIDATARWANRLAVLCPRISIWRRLPPRGKRA
ncbi:hypothetical protein [Mesorhizobium sp. B2-6-2]|uniref:hypothetical protein n=1 Tax=Mesorhizobium sp. B2-6-2 TaxID=2589915 RepID=UPI0015E34147|nr:hypothetical protein [Mesorhizobium sp. B2-6-2]